MPANQAKTHYLEAAILNHVLRGVAGGTAYTQPAHVYVALFTSNPGEGGSLAGEVVTTGGTAYLRQECIFGAPSTGTTGSQVANTVEIDFPTAGNNWGTCTHFGICDSPTPGAGNVLYCDALATPLTINTGDPTKFAIGTLVVKED